MAARSKAVVEGLRSICLTDESFREELFLGHVRRLFLRHHRATATGDSSDIRNYLAKDLRRRFDAAVAGTERAAPVSSIKSLRIVEATDSELGGERIVVRFAAVDAETDGGVLAEDWTFERTTAMARWWGRPTRHECPTCGGPRVRGDEVCQYCGIPLAAGGWLVTAIAPVALGGSDGTSGARVVAVVAVAVLALIGAVVAVVAQPHESEPDPIGEARAAQVTTVVPGDGARGNGNLTFSGAITQSRSGTARSIGGAGCDDVAAFSGFTVTALPGELSPDTITVGVTLAVGRGPGVYERATKPEVSITYQRSDPGDGRGAASQSWHAGGTGTATLAIDELGDMVVVFEGYVPRTTSEDPILAQDLAGTVTFTCVR